MKSILLAIAVKLIALALPGAKPLSATHPISVRAEAAAVAIEEETARVYGDMSASEQEKRARIAFVFAFHESGWQSNPRGSNDQGAAVGAMQIHLSSFPKGTFPEELTVASVRSNIRLSMRAGLLAMRFLETKCGDLASGMTAYATGVCPKKGYSIRLVLRRCDEAGVKNCN